MKCEQSNKLLKLYKEKVFYVEKHTEQDVSVICKDEYVEDSMNIYHSENSDTNDDKVDNEVDNCKNELINENNPHKNDEEIIEINSQPSTVIEVVPDTFLARFSGRFDKVKDSFKCPMCPKTYTKVSGLKVHLRVHSGYRPYSCDICKKSFVRADELARHSRTHLGDTPHVCQFCNKGFKERADLETHEKNHESCKDDKKSYLYVCPICNKRYTQSTGLRVHMRTHTGKSQLIM